MTYVCAGLHGWEEVYIVTIMFITLRSQYLSFEMGIVFTSLGSLKSLPDVHN